MEEKILSNDSFITINNDTDRVYIGVDIQLVTEFVCSACNFSSNGNNNTTNCCNVTITDSDTPTTNEASLIKDGQGPDMQEKILSGGGFTNISNDANRVYVDIDILAVAGFVCSVCEFNSNNNTNNNTNCCNVTITDSDAPGPGEASLLKDGQGPNMEEKILSNNTFITINNDTDRVYIGLDIESVCFVCDIISNNNTNTNCCNVTLTNAVAPLTNEASLIKDGQGPDMQEKILSDGGFMIITNDSNKVYIGVDINSVADFVCNNCTGNNNVTLTDATTPGFNEASLINDGNGPVLKEKILCGGNYTEVTSDFDKVCIDVDIQTVSNVVCENCNALVTLTDAIAPTTNEASLIKDGQGPDMQEKILAGGNYTIVTNESNKVRVDVDIQTVSEVVCSSCGSNFNGSAGIISPPTVYNTSFIGSSILSSWRYRIIQDEVALITGYMSFYRNNVNSNYLRVYFNISAFPSFLKTPGISNLIIGCSIIKSEDVPSKDTDTAFVDVGSYMADISTSTLFFELKWGIGSGVSKNKLLVTNCIINYSLA